MISGNFSFVKKITINYVNLSDSYKNREEFTNQDIKKFVDENKESLKEKIISFKYTKITPKNLIGLDEFNNLFFEKIDEIENEILNNSTFDSLINKYSLSSKKKQNFKLNNSNSSNEFYKKIYQNEETNKLTLLEENDFYVLYEITKSEKILPQIENKEFNNKIKTIIYNNAKYKFNSDLIKKIGEGFDMVSGWKHNRKDSLSKTFPSKIYNFVLRTISGIKIHD